MNFIKNHRLWKKQRHPGSAHTLLGQSLSQPYSTSTQVKGKELVGSSPPELPANLTKIGYPSFLHTMSILNGQWGGFSKVFLGSRNFAYPFLGVGGYCLCVEKLN